MHDGVCEVIYCFVSLGFLAYNWICFCRAFAGVSKYCAKNHLSTAEDWQNRSIFTLEYFIAVVIFNLGLNFRRRRAYSFFLSGKQSYCWTELLHILRMVRATILIQIYWLGGGEIKKIPCWDLEARDKNLSSFLSFFFFFWSCLMVIKNE